MYVGSFLHDSESNLFIAVPPGDPFILDQKGQAIMSPFFGPFDEGSPLTLTCKSNGGM